MRFGEAYALSVAQAGEAMERLHEQRPDDGFFSLDDYVRFHVLHFGIDAEIVHKALIMALDKDCRFEWSEKYQYYVDKIISVYRRQARMERIIHENSIELDYIARSLLAHGKTCDHRGRPLQCLLPHDNVVLLFNSSLSSRKENIEKRSLGYKDLVTVQAVEGFVGPEWYNYLGDRGTVTISLGGIALPEMIDHWA